MKLSSVGGTRDPRLVIGQGNAYRSVAQDQDRPVYMVGQKYGKVYWSVFGQWNIIRASLSLASLTLANNTERLMQPSNNIAHPAFIWTPIWI